MNNIDKIEYKKEINLIMQQARAMAKPEHCLLCGEPQTGFCNSHSVPRFTLKSIAESGKVFLATKILGTESFDVESGVNNSGTFHLICNKCDGTFFQDYESQDNMLNNVTDKMLAEIVVKDILLQLDRKNIVKYFYKIWQQHKHTFLNPEDLYATLEFDIKNYTEEMNFHKDIALNSVTGGYQILHYEILPYKIPIAFQSAIALDRDIEGLKVNDLHDFPDMNYRFQHLHIAGFPMEKSSCILAFYHKRDKRYRKLRHQFNSVSENTKLQYLNYLIFAYTENYFISKRILTELETNTKLKQLSSEANGRPNFGLFDEHNSYGAGYIPVSMNDIPNFLSKEWAI